jgi:hypothetical protein
MKIGNLHYIFLFLFLVSGSIAAQDKNTFGIKLGDSLVIDAKLEQDEFGLDDSVQLILTIKNVANYPIELFDPTLERGFDIEIKTNEGKNVFLTEEGRKKKYPDIILRREAIRFEPSQELSLKVDLNRLFDLSQEDSYSVSVKVRPYYISSPQKKNQTSEKVISSNTVKFKLKKEKNN